MKQRTYSQNMKKQQGFTLLELLVVVSVLATLAGITAVAMDGYEQDAQEQLVQTEMKRIASAIYRFKEDTGYFPKEGVFPDNTNNYDLSWLFDSPVSGGLQVLPWDVNSGRGWNGPYIDVGSQERVSKTDCDLDLVAAGDTFVGLSDTFERNIEGAVAECIVVLSEGNFVPRKFSGKPYEYIKDYTNAVIPECTGGKDCLVLLSYGEDSSKGSNDDIVHILRVNP